MTDRLELVQQLYRAYMEREWSTWDALVADSFRFTSPYDDAIDKAAFHERCWPLHGKTDMDIEHVASTPEGNAFVQYRLLTDDGRTIHNTELLTFTHANQVATVTVFFGPTYRGTELVKQKA